MVVEVTADFILTFMKRFLQQLRFLKSEKHFAQIFNRKPECIVELRPELLVDAELLINQFFFFRREKSLRLIFFCY